VAEIGYVMMGVGAGMIDLPVIEGFALNALKGGVFHMLNDSLDLGLLFLLAGAVFYVTRKRDLGEVSGLAHESGFLAVMFLIGTFAISGLPPMNGFASKMMIYESVYHYNPLLSIVGILGSIMMLAVFVKVFASVFLGAPYRGRARRLPATMAFAIALIAVLIIIIGLFPVLVLDNFITPAVEALVMPGSYTGGIL
jgi:multicomponent Na+:H+ antiporter subunit D